MTEATMVRQDGTYPTVPLRRDMIFVTAAQTRVYGVNGDNPAPDIRRNLDYFLECIDIAQSGGPPSDLLVFHEFPITGFSHWTREQHYRLAITLDGPELAEVAAKAKRYNCYIVFGGYFRDEKDWPGHILHQMILMGPNGVVANHWKQRNLRGMWPTEQYTTTIYDVYDRFVEMYGIDAVVPVVQTDIGNIAMSAVQFEPELFRCMAMKGAEIVCRVATGGFEYHDFRLTSYHNSVYTIATNNAVNTGPRTTGFFDDANYGGPGNSAIFGPRGIELENCGVFETKRTTMIPIGPFRSRHRIPDVHMDLYRPVFDQYRTRYDHSAYLKQIPAEKQEATKLFRENARWIHNWM